MKYKIKYIPLCFTNKLEIGDVFFGEIEFMIGRFKDRTNKIIEVGLINEDECYFEEDDIEQIFSKGKIFKFSTTRKVESKSIDLTRKNAVWCVEFIEHKKSLKLLHSILPETYLVRARRIVNNKYDFSGEVIEFYTINQGKNIIQKDFEIIGKLIKE